MVGLRLAFEVSMKLTAKDEDSARVRMRRRAPASKKKVERFQKTITVNRPVAEVYSFWRNPGNAGLLVKNLSVAASHSEKISHWSVKLNSGVLEWEAETVEARENESIAWRSLPGWDLDYSGSVSLCQAAGNRGTIVKFALEYAHLEKKTTAILGRAFGKDARSILETELYRFKSLLETGEIPTTQGQPKGNQG